MSVYLEKSGVGDSWTPLDIDDSGSTVPGGAFQIEQANVTGEAEIRIQNDHADHTLELQLRSRHVPRGKTQNWWVEDTTKLKPGQIRPVKITYQRDTEYQGRVRAVHSGETIAASLTYVAIPGEAK